jgi:hypothetical protein
MIHAIKSTIFVVYHLAPNGSRSRYDNETECKHQSKITANELYISNWVRVAIQPFAK